MGTDDRCYACCQENCGRRRCYCSCHGPTPKETDCPRGIHVPEMYRCGTNIPTEYWCMHCGTMTDESGKTVGPLAIANERAGKMIRDAVELIEDRKAFEQLDGKCPCKKHRTYRAIRKPTTSCEECWRFYVRMHP